MTGTPMRRTDDPLKAASDIPPPDAGDVLTWAKCPCSNWLFLVPSPLAGIWWFTSTEASLCAGELKAVERVV